MEKKEGEEEKKAVRVPRGEGRGVSGTRGRRRKVLSLRKKM